MSLEGALSHLLEHVELRDGYDPAVLRSELLELLSEPETLPVPETV